MLKNIASSSSFIFYTIMHKTNLNLYPITHDTHTHIINANHLCVRVLRNKNQKSYQMPYLQLTDGGNITVQQKDTKPNITHTHTNKGVVKRMFYVSDSSFQQGTGQR